MQGLSDSCGRDKETLDSWCSGDRHCCSNGNRLGAQEIKAQNFDEFVEGLQPIFETINATRPTAVNIHWAIERIKRFLAFRKDEVWIP